MLVNTKVHNLTISALLCAVGIVIPIFSPFKIILEPASFTLASHVAIFIAAFISPGAALAVSLGVAGGFFFAGFPLVVVLRAATHVVFALISAYAIMKKPQILRSRAQAFLFSFLIGCVHSLCEVMVVVPFYFGHSMAEAYYVKSFATSVILLVGVGTIVHSMVDFEISLLIWKPLQKVLKRA